MLVNSNSAWGKMARCIISLVKGELLTSSRNYAVILSNRYTSGSTWKSEDKETHTGQQWDKDDYRLARFVDRPKQVNEQFAIKLINEVPPAPREDRVVWCDGGGGPTGHPRVYINLDKPGNHICGYCGLRFTNKDAH